MCTVVVPVSFGMFLHHDVWLFCFVLFGQHLKRPGWAKRCASPLPCYRSRAKLHLAGGGLCFGRVSVIGQWWVLIWVFYTPGTRATTTKTGCCFACENVKIRLQNFIWNRRRRRAFFYWFFTLKNVILEGHFETCQSRVRGQSNVKRWKRTMKH